MEVQYPRTQKIQGTVHIDAAYSVLRAVSGLTMQGAKSFATACLDVIADPVPALAEMFDPSLPVSPQY